MNHLARLDRVHDFIHDHLADDLPVAKLAEVAYLSPWHFQRVFQEAMGESAGAFVRRLRVERAANLLLLHHNATVLAIALDCGFGTSELLARHFKERFGVSPSQWRSTPPAFGRTNRQVEGTDELEDSRNLGDPEFSQAYTDPSDTVGTISRLRLERRSERLVVYTRHYQGYDHGLAAAFQRLWHWAEPRGLLDADSETINIGLDNPWITEPERCRSFVCFTVRQAPDVGEGIGTRTLPGGLHAVIDYDGPRDGLSLAYRELYARLLPQAGVEALNDVDYLEYGAAQPSLPSGEFHVSLALPVRTL